MITSKRKFGIEIEFICTTESSLRKIADNVPVVRDGSLDPHPWAGEYVSPVLQGVSGIKEIRRVCELLKKHNASAENSQTSVHVHLDGCRGNKQLRSSSTIPTDVPPKKIYAVSNRLKKELGVEVLRQLVGQNLLAFSRNVSVSTFDNIKYFSLASLTHKPRVNFTYYWLESPDRTDWLRNTFYFYTLFSDVMEGIVSNSRKFGNMYCIPLGKSYDLQAIADCKTEEEIKSIWYKGRLSEGHYDDSRYHNVNLHCYWDRHGTVEIRSHGGTIDPNKIILWVKLHQKIVDKLETVTIEELQKLSGTYKEFVEFVEEPLLQDYVKRLAGYYSSIKI